MPAGRIPFRHATTPKESRYRGCPFVRHPGAGPVLQRAIPLGDLLADHHAGDLVRHVGDVRLGVPRRVGVLRVSVRRVVEPTKTDFRLRLLLDATVRVSGEATSLARVDRLFARPRPAAETG